MNGSILFHFLPYLEQDALHRKGSVWTDNTIGTPLRIFLDGRDKSAPPGNRFDDWLATCNFAANWMCFKDGKQRFPATFLDGTSNTIVFAERYQMCNGQPTSWGYDQLHYWSPVFAYYSVGKFQVAPDQRDCDPALAQALDPSGIHVGMGDGSVRRLGPA